MNHLKKVLRVSLELKKNIEVNRSSQALLNTSATNVSAVEDVTQSETPVVSPVLHRTLQFCPNHLIPRQTWIENLDDIKEQKRGLVELHPKIFGTMPRLDLIHENVKWQRLYQNVVLFSARVTPEMPGGGRKPWPQKGLGRARQGSIRAPQFIHGGTCHGPRNPTSHFYMLPWYVRLHGLTSTLSAKFAQDDLHVVDNLQIPTEDRQYVLDLIKERNWGPSVLLVDADDIMPRNITVATDTIGHVNLMPVYGLNVHGMLKHDTLILTLAAVEQIERRLVTLLNTANAFEIGKQLNS